MRTILDAIMEVKHKEVEHARMIMPLVEVAARARDADPPRGFFAALKKQKKRGNIGIIAEIKKASPSKGVIRQNFNPVELAVAYENGGATCLSILTDEQFFQGSNSYLSHAREVCELPCLRKDFIFDSYQITQSRAYGADCILLIMSVLDDDTVKQLMHDAKVWDMDVLVEVHSHDEMERVLRLDSDMIGINNRDLKTFEVDLTLSETLAVLAPENCLLISESGINTPEDIERLRDAGISTFLVGESLMRQDDVTQALRNLSA